MRFISSLLLAVHRRRMRPMRAGPLQAVRFAPRRDTNLPHGVRGGLKRPPSPPSLVMARHVGGANSAAGMPQPTKLNPTEDPMSLRINHNISALNGTRNMIRNDFAVSRSLEKLSSGLRINRAADDAAGLIISEQMRAQIAGLDQAVKNSETAVSLVQTAEGALDEMNTLLNKARQLALHAANDGANDSNQLAADQSELDNIVSSIDRIATNTQFGTKKILDGTLATGRSNNLSVLQSVTVSGLATGNYNLSVQASGTRSAAASTSFTDANASGIFNTIGTGASVSLASTFKAATTFSFGANTAGDIAAVNVTVAAGSTLSDALVAINTAGGKNGVSVTLSGAQLKATAADIGTYANGITFSVSGSGFTQALPSFAGGVSAILNVVEEGGTNTSLVGATDGLTAARGTTLTNTVTTAGVTESVTVTVSEAAATAAAGTNNQGVFSVTSGATFQVGANANQTASVAINSMLAGDLGTVSGETLEDLKTASFLTSGRAQDALAIIDKAIDDVTNARGDLGAFQSATLESGLNSLRATYENMTAAESTIRDVDFASESAIFTRNQILIQASTAMMAQANQLPQNVLQLLQG